MDTKLNFGGEKKLNDFNYAEWANAMKYSLMHETLWGYANGTVPKPGALDAGAPGAVAHAENIRKWVEKDEKAQSAIFLSIEGPLRHLVIGAESSAEMWQACETEFKKKSGHSITKLVRELYRTDLAEGGDVVAHLNHFRSLQSQLKQVNYTLTDEQLAYAVCQSLPASYENVIDSATDADGKVKYDKLKQQLVNKHVLSSGGDDLTNSALLAKPSHGRFPDRSNQQQRKQKHCFKCGYEGHMHVDCRYGGCKLCDVGNSGDEWHWARNCPSRNSESPAANFATRYGGAVALSARLGGIGCGDMDVSLLADKSSLDHVADQEGVVCSDSDSEGDQQRDRQLVFL